MSWRAVAAILVAVTTFVLARVEAEPSFPPLTGRIVDQADLLSPEQEAKLAEKLANLESRTGNQLVIVTLRSLEGYDIADYGYQLGRKWGIGQKGKNNGAVLLV